MLGLGFYGIQMWNDGICDECGELTCLGTVWCEACADYHHGYVCKPEQETPTPEQAALDAQHCAGLEAARDQADYCRYGY